MTEHAEPIKMDMGALVYDYKLLNLTKSYSHYFVSAVMFDKVYEQKIMERKYLSIKEAAKILRVSPLTLRNWDRKSVLTAYRNPVNNYRMYRADQIEMFLRRLENSKNKHGGKKIDISLG